MQSKSIKNISGILNSLYFHSEIAFVLNLYSIISRLNSYNWDFKFKNECGRQDDRGNTQQEQTDRENARPEARQ